MGRSSDARARLIQSTIDLIWSGSYGAVTVDAICEQSGVKKGSFYHFFKSKDDLVLAALDAHWEERRPTLDRLFSPTLPPLERLAAYFDNIYERQKEKRARYGSVVGCFYGNVGMECAEKNPEIAHKVQTILNYYVRYYESALRDAYAEGQIATIRPRDIPAKAKMLFAYMEGMMGQARIRNDLEALRSLSSSAMLFLGVTQIAVRGHRKAQ